MKRLLLLGLLSIAAISTSAPDAHAWFFDWCRGCRSNSYNIKICVRQYNAFSPPCCYGMPINFCGGCLPQQPMPSCFGCPSYGPGCCTSDCCDFGCLPAPGSFANAPQDPMPAVQAPPMPQGNPGPQFQAPNPQLLNQSSYMVPMQVPPAYGYGPAQPAAYYPMYNPYSYSTAPVNYYGPPQAPGYWYGR